MLTCTVVKPQDLTARDRACWLEMAETTPAFASPLLSPQFVDVVSAVRDDVRVAVFRKGGKTKGFLAYHQRPNRFARPAGAPFSDYSALITFPDTRLRAAPALAKAGIDRFHLSGLVDPHGVFGDPQGLNDAVPDHAYAMDLSADEPTNNVVKKHSKNINRLRRHMIDQLGEVRFVIGDRDRNHFDTMIRIKREQVHAGGLHDFLGAPWVERMLLDLFEAPEDGLHGMMVTLMAGDTPLMYHFGPRLGTRAHPWVSSYDASFGALSPGQVFLNDCRMPLKAAGVAWYDLSTGQQHYKPAFCNTHSVVHNAIIFGEAPQARAKAAFLGVARSIQRALGPVDSLLARIDRRMEQIASLELEPIDRLRGFGFALTHASRRGRSEHA